MVTKLFGPILFTLGACSAAPVRPPSGPSTAATKPPQGQSKEAVRPAPVPPLRPLAASEVEARGLLSQLFRASGLRIVNDRILRSGDLQIALDGYDPERRIGYEYVAAAEGDSPLSMAEDRALEQHGKILVVRGGTLDEIEERANSFLRDALASVNPEP